MMAGLSAPDDNIIIEYDYDELVKQLGNKKYNNWDEVLADSEINIKNFPGRIELDGNTKLLIFKPMPEFEHSELQSKTSWLLRNIVEELGLKGSVLTEYDVKLSDGGMRRPDVAYVSLENKQKIMEERGKNKKLPKSQRIYTVVPDICIEIKSPGNDWPELYEKKTLFFRYGASEVWIADEDGNFKFYENNNSDLDIKKSKIMPDFPSQVIFENSED